MCRHQRLIPGASPTGIKLKSILDLVPLKNLKCLFTGGYDIRLLYPQIAPRKSPRDSVYAPLFIGGERENRLSYRNKIIWDVCQYTSVYSVILSSYGHSLRHFYFTQILQSLPFFFGYFYFTFIQLAFALRVIKTLLCYPFNKLFVIYFTLAY